MNKDTFGLSHLSELPVTVVFAIVIAAALILLTLLRHLFGSIRVDAGTN